MSDKRKTLKTLADFFSNIPAWMKDKAEPFDPIEPLVPQKPRPDIEPPKPVKPKEYDK